MGMIALRHILVASDFGEPAAVALAYGRELARTFDATLHVVHVVDRVDAHLEAVDGFAEYAVWARVQAQVEATGRAALDALITDEDRTTLRARGIVLISASPAAAILDYARTAFVDLIVAGTHGRGALAHVLMGSVAERLVRSAPCPVLTVRHPEHDFLRPDALQARANV
jgi:nucleotide-binding universal stress UspA family protein